MQYFLDKLKEFLVFLVFSRLVQGVVGTRACPEAILHFVRDCRDSVPHLLWDLTPFRGV